MGIWAVAVQYQSLGTLTPKILDHTLNVKLSHNKKICMQQFTSPGAKNIIWNQNSQDLEIPSFAILDQVIRFTFAKWKHKKNMSVCLHDTNVVFLTIFNVLLLLFFVSETHPFTGISQCNPDFLALIQSDYFWTNGSRVILCEAYFISCHMSSCTILTKLLLE